MKAGDIRAQDKYSEHLSWKNAPDRWLTQKSNVAIKNETLSVIG